MLRHSIAFVWVNTCYNTPHLHFHTSGTDPLACVQKSKKQKAAKSAQEDLPAATIAAVSADPAKDPVVIVKKDAESSAVLVSSNGTTEPVKLEETALGHS